MSRNRIHFPLTLYTRSSALILVLGVCAGLDVFSPQCSLMLVVNTKPGQTSLPSKMLGPKPVAKRVDRNDEPRPQEPGLIREASIRAAMLQHCSSSSVSSDLSQLLEPGASIFAPARAASSARLQERSGMTSDKAQGVE